jgi:hypothetical protein
MRTVVDTGAPIERENSFGGVGLGPAFKIPSIFRLIRNGSDVIALINDKGMLCRGILRRCIAISSFRSCSVALVVRFHWKMKVGEPWQEEGSARCGGVGGKSLINEAFRETGGEAAGAATPKCAQ